MSIAVIIPFHNGFAYLKEAVDSCLQQREVAEILLINDHSTDKSQELAQALARQYANIKVLATPGEAPLGPGAARNIGIQHTHSEFVAFLDADDVYVSNRFKDAMDFFRDNPEADGFYEPTGVYNLNFDQLLTQKGIRTHIAPDALFKELLMGRFGHFNIPGIVLRKSAFLKAGLFNEELRWHQDTELWFRLAFHARLYGNPNGPIKAKVRQHAANHSKQASSETRQFHWEQVLEYFKNRPTRAHAWYVMLLRLGMEAFHPPSRANYLALPLLFLKYPMYFWIWLRKWIRE